MQDATLEPNFAPLGDALQLRHRHRVRALDPAPDIVKQRPLGEMLKRSIEPRSGTDGIIRDRDIPEFIPIALALLGNVGEAVHFRKDSEQLPEPRGLI